MDLSIIILNWNTCEDLERALCSLEAQAAGVPVTASGRQAQPAGRVEVIVVDNASTDGSAERVRDRFPWARLIVNPRNLGFSAGNNVGLRAMQGRAALLLNPDTVAHPDAIERLLDFAGRHPEAGIIGVKLLNRDGSLQYSARTFPTLATGFFRNTVLGRFFPRNRYTRDYLLTDWDHDSEREVDWVSGAALFARREVLDQIGLLDERFFMYCEDVDLCYRARQRGWKVLYCPHAQITHLIARASDQNAAAMIRQFHASMFRFFRKHYAARSNPLVWPLIIAGLTLRASLLMTRNAIDRFRMRHGW